MVVRMAELQSELLCEVHVDLNKPIELGITPRGNRQIYYTKGDSLKGPSLKGVVIPGETSNLRVYLYENSYSMNLKKR